ncbi:MAG: F0F1 ATP synthase subunit alpha [Candidatus Sumerlaeia bacterium]|nr:F0F1 ATP synthase subunit alpha [Candidatus Sumerlaeia bacterium]
MSIRPDEIASILQQELEGFESHLNVEDVGTVLKVGDSIATVYGLRNAMSGEMLEFPGGLTGMVLNLEENSVGVALFGSDARIKEGDTVRRTGKIMSVPVGEELVGRVVNAVGLPIDGKGPITTKDLKPVESGVPNVLARQSVYEPLMTGIKAIDSMIPIGRGQRELIIGDRQTGKTAIALDTIINQKGKDVYCFYVAIGQKQSSVAGVVETLKEHGAMEYTTVISASADTPASMQFIAPYAATAMAEFFLYSGRHALIIYDDLSKQAAAYRTLSLLLRRPPGREAYPGDVFYLHSRLLERAAKISEDQVVVDNAIKTGGLPAGTKPGGSLTSLPIIETQAGDVAAYIPTNVISITDGQIYLEPDLFYQGIRPAVNVGLSVSRVGGSAQTKIMKKIAGTLRLSLAQFRELEAFAKFGSDLDKSTQAQLTRGARTVEVLKQGQYIPFDLASQVLIIYVATNGYLDEVPVERLGEFEAKFKEYVAEKYPNLTHRINTDRALTEEIEKELVDAAKTFVVQFLDAEPAKVS